MITNRILKALKNPEKIIPYVRNKYAPNAFSGVIFPIDVLPSYLQKLSFIFPSSFSLDLVRGAIIEEKYLIDMLKDFFGIIVLSFFYLILGIFAVQTSIIKAKKNGTIGHY